MMIGLTALMKKQGRAPAMLLGLSLTTLSLAAHADTVMNITGNIKASPCAISLPAGGLNVDLGQNIQASTLAEAGSASDWKAFSIALTACPASTTVATMTLNGVADEAESTMYANAGTASEVQIELQNNDGTPLGNAAQISQNVGATSRDTTFDLRARVYTANGKATPGTIVGTVQVTFTYQ